MLMLVVQHQLGEPVSRLAVLTAWAYHQGPTQLHCSGELLGAGLVWGTNLWSTSSLLRQVYNLPMSMGSGHPSMTLTK